MKEPRSRRVFISFAEGDRTFARQLQRELERGGLEVWTHDKLQTGDAIPQQVEKAFRQSEFVVFVISTRSSDSPNLMFELGAAAAQAKRIIPVFRSRRARSEIPAFTSTLQSVSAEGRDAADVGKRIRTEIAQALATAS